MKRGAIICPALVVLLSISVFHMTDLQLPNCKGTSSDQRIDDMQPRTIEHIIKGSELQLLKSRIGVKEENQNYNQIVCDHGTGLAPPSEADWEKIGKEAYVVDQVLFPTSLPSNVDNSATPWFPPIGNQGSQGSCVAWAVGYYTKTFQEAKEHGWDLSGAIADEVMSPSFIYNLINWGVDGGSSFYTAINLVCSVGDCSLAKMPYNAADCTSWPSEEAWIEAAFYRGNYSGYEELQLTTDAGLASLKNWIAANNLAIIGVDASQYVNLSSNDVWTVSNYVNPSVDHANTIVGYDDNFQYTEEGQLRQGAFKIANSWGVGWYGDHNSDGFYWISLKAMEQRVQYCMFYCDRIGYVPTFTASFRIQHPMRGECSIEIGMGTHGNPTVSKSFTEYVYGGNRPFCSNNIVFDITEFEDAVPSIYGKPFFLSVYDGGSPATGTLLYFSVANTVSSNPPVITVNGGYVFADLTLEETSGKVYFSVEPVAVAPLADVNCSLNGLETPTLSPIGQYFTVQIHLRNATATNAPDGVAGVEVHLNFSALLPYVQVVNYTDMLGQLGGVLNPSLLYGITARLADSSGVAQAFPYTTATQYIVAAASTGLPWNEDDGLVAIIYFKITGQPSFSQPDFYQELYIPSNEYWLIDATGASMRHVNVPGTLHIDAQPLVHDVAVTNCVFMKTVVGQGYGANMSITVANQGNITETFNVTVYANTTAIGTQQLILNAANQTTLTFVWNTMSCPYGNYTISTYALPVPNETNTANNNCTGGWVKVTIPGDLNGDFKDSLADLVILANAYGSHCANYHYPGEPASPNWNPNADVNNDDIVTLLDLVTMANHYGQHYP